MYAPIYKAKLKSTSIKGTPYVKFVSRVAGGLAFFTAASYGILQWYGPKKQEDGEKFFEDLTISRFKTQYPSLVSSVDKIIERQREKRKQEEFMLLEAESEKK